MIYISASCCSGRYQISESSNLIFYQNQNSVFKNLYPVWSDESSWNFEKNNYTLKIMLEEGSILFSQKELTIYVESSNGSIVDRSTQINFKTFEKNRCESGIKNSFTHWAKFYPMQELQPFTLN